MPTPNPYADLDCLNHLQNQLSKGPPTDLAVLRLNLEEILKDAGNFGPALPEGARVLDVGCGIGDSVQILASMGYDASGIDIVEYWDRDFGMFWEDRPKPQGPHLAQLHRIDSEQYHLPFPDGHFDFALSSQLFEHVFNYEEVFREVARVLKPGGISIHIFPGPNALMEPHINVPIPALCQWKPYLALWALLGRRSARQQGFRWRNVLESNLDVMRICNYPSKRQLFELARRAGVRIEFLEIKKIRLREQGRIHDLLRRTPRQLRGLVEYLITLRYQRVMLIHALPSGR